MTYITYGSLVGCFAGLIDDPQSGSQAHNAASDPSNTQGDPSATCMPTTCQAQAKNCGSIPDGCGAVLNCGICANGQTCAGGGMQNVCGTALADQGPDPVIVAAGDIAGSWSGDESTAAVIDTIKPAAVLTLGDNVYDTGAASEFNNYWGAKTAANKSWGHLLDVVKPAPGNHDHATANLTGYCGYFGASAHCAGGDSGAAYYSFDVGKWHIISLDSGCSSPSSCADTMATGSTMRTWLTNDLKAHNNACMIAYWHHPRFSSGAHGNDTRSQSVWAELQAAGVDLILNGHDHNYERFAAQNSAGASDPNGIVEFVVGTGGTSLRAMGATKANSAKINNTSLGVLKLTLHDTSYDFEFVKANGTFTDKGVGIACH